GRVIAESVAEFLSSLSNRTVIDKMRSAGLILVEPPTSGSSPAPTAVGTPSPVPGAEPGAAPGTETTLAGRSVVVTGAIDGYTRQQAQEAILDRGGKSPGSVSAKTFAVVVGAEPGGAKLLKAEQLGVPLVDGSRFDLLLETGEIPEP
ncbi:MAG: BRCT domain-containing protein, partial [Acidimicrobiales bacterium]